MIILLLERHKDPHNQCYNLLNKVRTDRRMNEHNCVDYLKTLDQEHPERQIEMLEDILKRYDYPAILTPHVGSASAQHVVILTASLIVVYWFNNELQKNPNINLEAYEVIGEDTTKGIPTRITSAMRGNWIDETLVSRIYDKLRNNPIRLSANKNGI